MWIASALLLAAVESASMEMPALTPVTPTPAVCAKAPDAKKPHGSLATQCPPVKPAEPAHASPAQTTNLFVNAVLPAAAAAGTAPEPDGVVKEQPKPILPSTCTCECCAASDCAKGTTPDIGITRLGDEIVVGTVLFIAVVLLAIGVAGLFVAQREPKASMEPATGYPSPGYPPPGYPERKLIRFRRHWGSFGGESTGWTIDWTGWAGWTPSRRLVVLCISLLLIVIGLWLVREALASQERLSLRPVAPSVVVCRPAAK